MRQLTVEYGQTGKLHSLAEDLFIELFCETFGLKQNSLIHDNWKVYRWVYNQLKHTPEKVKDEFRIFLGDMPVFKMLNDYLPPQKGKILELKNHQVAALSNLQEMRLKGESIALLYHATGTGKTVTAVSDARKLGRRTLFLAHTQELVAQAKSTFQSLWDDVSTGMYVAEQKIKMPMWCVVVFKVLPVIWRNLDRKISAM
ncbi:DEAD/DEAH box helicase family protein [Desulfitobacterium metallireducens]|uniref:DEAD/DEAH box helicase n=1 Tax=Desulfitobacterium metallireducens TaxID=142877 RepID=UPI0002313262